MQESIQIISQRIITPCSRHEILPYRQSDKSDEDWDGDYKMVGHLFLPVTG